MGAESGQLYVADPCKDRVQVWSLLPSDGGLQLDRVIDLRPSYRANGMLDAENEAAIAEGWYLMMGGLAVSRGRLFVTLVDQHNDQGGLGEEVAVFAAVSGELLQRRTLGEEGDTLGGLAVAANAMLCVAIEHSPAYRVGPAHTAVPMGPTKSRLKLLSMYGGEDEK
jgi:hypothetical protein